MISKTREERKRRVLDLHNQGMGTREIAHIMHMSFRDIAIVLKDEDERSESEQQRTREQCLSSEAYRLFSEGKSPTEVAIKLKMRAQQAITFYREYWDLKALYELNSIYEETKDKTWTFINLYRLARNSRMGPQQVNNLLNAANNDLEGFEYRIARLKEEIILLELQ